MAERKKVLVTGASGLLGANLLYHAPDSWDVVGLVHQFPLKTSRSNIQVVPVDLLDSRMIYEIHAYGPYDIIIHCAALTNVNQCQAHKELARRLNVEVTDQLARYANDHDIHMVHMSTDHFFDGVSGNYTEDSPVHPLNWYAQTKWEAEERIRASGAAHTIIRTNFFGSNVQDKDDIAGWFLGALRRREPLQLFVDVFFSPIVVNLLIEYMISLIDKGITGLYNVAAHNRYSKYQFCMELATVFGLDTTTVSPVSIEASSLTVVRPKDMSLDTHRIESVLGTTMPMVTQSIERYKQLCDAHYPHQLKYFFS